MLELVIDVDGAPANILWWMNRSKSLLPEFGCWFGLSIEFDDRTREGRP